MTLILPTGQLSTKNLPKATYVVSGRPKEQTQAVWREHLEASLAYQY